MRVAGWQDEYEPSRLLLPELVRGLGLPDPVALLPLRASLLVCSGRDELALAEMAAMAGRLVAGHRHWLSLAPLRLAESGWQPFEPPPAVARAFEDLRRSGEARAYQEQKALIEQRHAHAGGGAVVAAARLVRGDEDGALVTRAWWPRGVEVLLPQVGQVALEVSGPAARLGVRDADGRDLGAQFLVVDWAALWTVAAGLLEPTAHAPTRYRTLGFPDEAAIRRLRAVAIGPA